MAHGSQGRLGLAGTRASAPLQVLEQIPESADFVLIGEASHGTHEFYQLRGDVTKLLIQERGFNAVATEAGKTRSMCPMPATCTRACTSVSDAMPQSAACRHQLTSPHGIWMMGGPGNMLMFQPSLLQTFQMRSAQTCGCSTSATATTPLTRRCQSSRSVSSHLTSCKEPALGGTQSGPAARGALRSVLAVARCCAHNLKRPHVTFMWCAALSDLDVAKQVSQGLGPVSFCTYIPCKQDII
jgi:hypothetical protein